MPGLGFRTALKILTIVGDGAAFPTAGHLAAYAGLPRSPADPAPPSVARPAPSAATTR